MNPLPRENEWTPLKYRMDGWMDGWMDGEVKNEAREVNCKDLDCHSRKLWEEGRN